MVFLSSSQAICLNRYIGQVTPKIVNFHYLKNVFWIKEFKKILNFEKKTLLITENIRMF